MKANRVLDLLKISRQTLCKYVKTGQIKVKTLPSGRYDYDESSVYEFLGRPQELFNDLMGVIHSFSMKLYGKRRLAKKILKEY